jgi:hypothetical protein
LADKTQNPMQNGIHLAPNQYQLMAQNPRAYCRTHPINHAYLEDLAKLGPYGKDKSDVVRRFVEDGLRLALESGVIGQRDIENYGGVQKDPEEDG